MTTIKNIKATLLNEQQTQAIKGGTKPDFVTEDHVVLATQETPDFVIEDDIIF